MADITKRTVQVQEPPDRVLWECFRHFFHLDHSNAAMHCAPVRFSPITFRVAETIWHTYPNYRPNLHLQEVVAHLGEYAEDPGR